MKLREWLTELNELASGLTDEQLDSFTVVSSSDDEGNSFGEVLFAPSLGRIDGCDWQTENDAQENEQEVNAVCIN